MFKLGETLSFECLIYSLFEFVQILMDLSMYKNSVKSSMEELCYYLILCMQITEEEVTFILFFLLKINIVFLNFSMILGQKMFHVMLKMKVMIHFHILSDYRL